MKNVLNACFRQYLEQIYKTDKKTLFPRLFYAVVVIHISWFKMSRLLETTILFFFSLRFLFDMIKINQFIIEVLL